MQNIPSMPRPFQGSTVDLVNCSSQTISETGSLRAHPSPSHPNRGGLVSNTVTGPEVSAGRTKRPKANAGMRKSTLWFGTGRHVPWGISASGARASEIAPPVSSPSRTELPVECLDQAACNSPALRRRGIS